MVSTKALLITAVVVLVACSAGDSDKPYFEFIGGGFIFNYRLAQAEYGLVARRVRPIPTGAIVEAVFENPSGGGPFIIRETAKWGRTQYVFRTPPVERVKANRDYHVELRLIDPTNQQIIATYTKTFRSDVDQSILPERPTVIGPGYQPALPEEGS